MRKYSLLRISLTFLCLLTVAVALTCCAGGDRSSHETPVSLPTINDQPISYAEPAAGGTFMSPGQIPRRASEVPLLRFRYGADYDMTLPTQRVDVLGQSLVFTPDWDTNDPGAVREPAWSIFRFSLAGYSGEERLHLDWMDGKSPVTEAGWYVGFSDFTKDSWYWVPGDESGSIVVPDPASFKREDGEAFAVVILLGTQGCELNWLRLGGNMAPVAMLSADPSAGPAPLSTSFSSLESFDLDGNLVDLEWDLDGDGEFNEPGSEITARGDGLVDYIFAESGSFNPVLRVTDDTGATATSNTYIEASSTAMLDVRSWGGSGTDAINAAATDSAGNIYLVGSTASFGAGLTDALIMKYTPAGELAWVRSWGAVGEDNALAVAVQEPGILHVTGLTTIPDGGTVAMILEYGTDGSLRNSRVWGSC